MADHVAVLRGIQRLLVESGKGTKREVSALDHAIATCEQHAALVAERDDYRTAAAWEAKRADELQAKHAALVARLGELEKVWRSQGETWGPSGGANARQVCADDLARVVAGNGGGE